MSPAFENFVNFAEVPDGIVDGVVLPTAAEFRELQAVFPAFGVGKTR
jgi:hypothetical protein